MGSVFSSEVTAGLRITDGAIVVVDAVEGVSVQTETVLRQALAEQVKPILLVNKIDRYIFELKLEPEEMYQKMVRIIESINVVLSTYKPDNSPLELDLSPDLGNVMFGTGYYCWGFGIHNFAKMYAKKFGVDESKLMKQFWGEHYFDPDTKKITTESTKDGKPLERTFCKFILGPITKLVRHIMNNETEEYNKMLDTLGIKLSKTEKENTGKDLHKVVMKKFLPLGDALLHGIVHHLPSPKVAQSYRYTTLYDGPLDDECATSIKNCDENGPLMLYISKMIPTKDGGRFLAFGRVFSGTVAAGQKVRILGANYKPGMQGDLYENKSIQRVCKMIGGNPETFESVTCGNTVALIGVDQYLLKSGTITTSSSAYPIKTMKFSVSPVVRKSVKPKNPSELPKLVEGLKKLSKSDPCVICTTNDKENIVAGVGELHLEICLNDLKDFMKSDIIVSEPIVPLRETVTQQSSQVCLAKSPNKHNRLFMTAQPVDSDLVIDMETGIVMEKTDVNERAKILTNKYKWNPNDAKKIWYFGPEDYEATNMIVDVTKGVQYLNEIKEYVNGGFQESTNQGVLCREPVRGVRFDLHDVTVHSDSVHRGVAQITPAARNVMYAAQLTAKPTVMEPVYLIEIQVPQDYVGTMYSCLSHKRGRVISEESNPTNPLCVIKGYLPVAESFGFDAFIREKSSGKAFSQLIFDHWEVMPGDPFDPSTIAGKMVRATRIRKGLLPEVESLDKFLDKL